jgi:hypothetical protein
VKRSALLKWLQDAATKSGQPNLVLAMISMLLAATKFFFYTEFLASSADADSLVENSHCEIVFAVNGFVGFRAARVPVVN